jgi:hypothetical protein
MGCGLESEWKMFLFCDQLLQLLWIKADDDLVANNDRWGRAALVRSDHLADSTRIAAHVTQLERNPSLREVGFRPVTRWSTRLAE